MKHFFTLLLLSISFYTVNAQTITVVNPNGGEILSSCQVYTVTWNTTGTLSDYYNLDYSLDGGTIWASVATNVLSTNNQYSWTVPNAQSTTCLIRVKDAQNGTIVDQSDAVFTINIPVELLTPNGGQSFLPDSVYDITWNHTNTSNVYDIHYSINGGSSWIQVANNFSTSSGVYSWTIPNNPSTTCKVRVMDAFTTCAQDISINNFTILPKFPLITFPSDSTDVFYAGCSDNITWDPSTFYTNVKIEYSDDSGVTWNLIDAQESNDGYYNWRPTRGVYGDNYRIKISHYNDPSVYDISDYDFSVANQFKMINFNGGDTLIGCSKVNITWQKDSYCTSRFNLYYSLNGGTTWNTIATNYYHSNSNNIGTYYNWTVPNNAATYTNVKFKVADYYYATSMFVESDTTLTFIPSNDVTLTYPNGGEVFSPDSIVQITWTNLPSASGAYRLSYSTNGGSSYTSIATNLSGNAYNWTVPNIPSTNVRVKVADNANICKEDISDNNLTIIPKPALVTFPSDSTDVFYAGCSDNITWDPSTFYTNVKIEYSDDSGVTWNLIDAQESNDGYYNWRPTRGVYGDNYRIKISHYNDPSVYDISDYDFSVANQFKMINFNGGDTLIGCSKVNITWQKDSYCTSRFNLYYSLNGGTTWNTIATNYYHSNSNNIGTYYNWTVPNNAATYTNVKFKVADYYYATSMFVESDSALTIIPSNDVTLTYPNGGEVFSPDSIVQITWTNLPSASGAYRLSYSTNGGSSYTSIATNLSGNAYNWTVPNIPSTNVRVKVADNANICKEDISDNNLTIIPKPALVTFPSDSTDVFYAGCSDNITWDPSTFYTNVKIEYSDDSGVTWNLIDAQESNDGYYNWRPTRGVYGDNYRIKISHYNDPSVYDISDYDFSVANQFKMINFNGGDTLIGCSKVNITWQKDSYCTSRFNLYYSLNGGTTWNTIATNYYHSNSNNIGTYYNWTVPNNAATYTNVKFKVADYYYATSMFVESDTTLTFIPSNDVTLTYPNGGEVFSPDSIVQITWTNLPSASGAYRLSYSTNGGSSYTSIATNLSGNAYNWTVPNIPSTNVRVKVADNANICKEDISDNNLTIIPKPALVTFPSDSTDVFYAGCSDNITWDPSTFYTNVKIEYSDDSGVTWNLIDAQESNDGYYNWRPTRGVYGDNYRIKISHYNDPSVYDISDYDFSVANQFKMINFNGGDTLIGCSKVNITWQKDSYCTSRFNLYYSLNGGTTWNTIATNYYHSNSNNIGTYYNWTVPNNAATYTNVKFKVADYYYATSMFVESDTTLTFIPSNDVTLTYPNGGEVFSPDSIVQITWTNLPSASGAYRLSYSTNGGSSYTSIATNLSGNAYNWTVPNIPSTNVRVKVADNANICKEDISDNNLTIIPKPALVTFPSDSTDVFYAGCSDNITWDPSTFYTNVKIEYSDDSGVTWNLIDAQESNDGYYNWRPTRGVYGDNYRIKISHYNDPSVYDISDYDFSVANQFKMINFNGGDTLIGCSKVNITWQKDSYCTSRFNLYYSLNGGTTWNTIATNYYHSNSNNIGTYYNWTVPNNAATYTNVKFKVADYYYATSMFVESDTTLTFIPSNDVTLTYPNGGEVFSPDSIVQITWTNLPSASGAYRLSYSTNGGSSYTSIATNLSGNAYNWTVPNIPSTNVRVKVADNANICKEDISDNNLTIIPKPALVTFPNGGENLYCFQTTPITWDPTTFYSNVRIEYSIDNGTTWITIDALESNDGYYNWSIPNVPSEEALVRVRQYNDFSISDDSDTTFVINPAVTILTPNGDNGITNWGGCAVTSITFDHTPYYDRWNFEYSLNNGITWNTIATNVSISANPATYNWTMPNVSNSQVLTRVEAYYNSNNANDESDSTFTIEQPVTLIQPNFGGIMQVGTNYTISWSSDGISNLYDIDFSSNGGSTWSNIVTGYNTSTNTYNWLVPSTVSSNCRVRIRDNINSCKQDISDQFFTISTSAPAITLLNPNGGDTLTGCSDYTINWSETSAFGNYDIAYSTNSGSTWNDIALNYATSSQNYVWNVPNITSNTVLVRVKPTGNINFDLSDAWFSIAASSINILTNDTTINFGESVQLEATGTATYTWSPSTSLNNASIYNPIATPTENTTYTVQNISGTCVLTDSMQIEVNLDTLSVSIATNNDTICDGDLVTYTASVINGGSSPTYQWMVNNAGVGTNSNVYSSSSLADGDLVKVVVSSNLGGVYNPTETSNTIDITVLQNSATTFNLTSCNPADTGTVIQNLTNYFGCDSIVTTNTTLLPSNAVTVNLTSCNPADTGTVVQNLTNQFMCDSLVTTITTLLPSDAVTVNLTSCNPADTGTVVQNLMNQFMCDSIVTTITALLPSFTTTVNDTICANENYTLPDATIVNTAGIYTTTLQADNTCDSVITTNLFVNPIHNITVNLTSCNVADTGSVIQNLMNQFGCDSTVTTITTLLTSDAVTVNLTSCNPADTGTVVQNLTNEFMCDSIVTTITTLLPSDAVTVNLTSCNPADTGTIVQNLTNQFMCDSIVTTITTLLPSDAVTVNLTSCNPADTGTVVQNLMNQYNCDSIVTTITSLLPSFATTVNDTICANENYTLPDASIVNTTGTYTTTLQADNTCDSVITTNLVVNPIHNITVNLTSCNVADTGSVIQNLTNQFMCDSIVTTITSLLASDAVTVNLTSCNPNDVGSVITTLTNQAGCDSVVTTNTTLLASSASTVSLTSCNPADVGTIITTLTNQAGCDSVVTTNTTLLASSASTVNLTSCNPNNVGTVITTLTNQAGCDSVVTTNTTLLASSASTVNLTSCNPNDVGTVITTLTNQAGCDSVVTTNTTLLASSASTVNLTSCNPNDVGTVITTLTNQAGCDSVVTTNTTLLASSASTVNLTSCNPNDVGTVITTLTNQAGCDSVVTTNTTLLASSASTVNLTSCNPNDVGTVIITLTNQAGCDSVVTTNTTLLASSASTVNLTSCNPNDVGTVITTLTNQAGCDSVVTTNTTLLASSASTVNLTSCNPNDVGTVITTLTNQAGCDSVVTTNTTLLASSASTVNLTSCNPNDVGTVVTTLTNQAGCDSVVTTNTTLLASSASTLNLTSCDPNDVGTVITTLTNQAGCDSVVTTNTTLLASSASTVNLTSCDPNDVGTVITTLTNQAGCDSVITTNTSLLPSSSTTIDASICESETYTLPDASVVNTAGTYTTTLTAANTCDSVITTNLTVNEEYLITESYEICSGESYTFPDGNIQANITSTFSYTSNLISSNNCDSIIETTITIMPIVTSVSVNSNVLTADMNGATYQWINCADNLDIAGETSQTYTPTSNGEYAVKVGMNACTETSDCYKILGIGITNTVENNLFVYPNPVLDVLFIEYDNEIQSKIVNMLGAEVTNSNKKAINVGELSAGVYFIHIYNTNNELISINKFVKK